MRKFFKAAGLWLTLIAGVLALNEPWRNEAMAYLTDIPIATLTFLGAIKPDGATLTVAADGTLSSLTAASVATQTALGQASTASFPAGVWRLDYASGNGAPPVYYTAETGVCGAAGNYYIGTTTLTVNDGGSCVNSSDGNSWVVHVPETGIDWREFGVVSSASANQTNWQKGLDFAKKVGVPLLVNGPGTYVITGGVYFYDTPVVWGSHQVIVQRSGTTPFNGCMMRLVDAVGNTYPTAAGIMSMTLRQPTIDLNASLETTNPGAGLCVSAVNNWLIDDPVIYDIPTRATAALGSATVTISLANPAVITWTNHGLIAGSLVAFTNSGGALPAAITSGTYYYVLAAGLTANSFEISATPNGSAISTQGNTQSGTQTGSLGAPAGHFLLPAYQPITATTISGTGWAPNGGIVMLGDFWLNTENGYINKGIVGNLVNPFNPTAGITCASPAGGASLVLSMVMPQAAATGAGHNPPNANSFRNSLFDCSSIGVRADYSTANNFENVDTTGSGRAGFGIGTYGRAEFVVGGTPSGTSTVSVTLLMNAGTVTCSYTGTGTIYAAAAGVASSCNGNGTFTGANLVAGVYPGTAVVWIAYADERSANTADLAINFNACGQDTIPACTGVLTMDNFWASSWNSIYTSSGENSPDGGVNISFNSKQTVISNLQQFTGGTPPALQLHGGQNGPTTPQIIVNRAIANYKPGTVKSTNFTTNCVSDPQPYLITGSNVVATLGSTETGGTVCKFVDALGVWQTSAPFTVLQPTGTWGVYTINGLNNNKTVTITNANPAVVTWGGGSPATSGFAAGQPIVFTTTGTLPTGLSPNTVYYVISAGLTATAFEVSATVGGSAIATSSAGSGTHTATAFGATSEQKYGGIEMVMIQPDNHSSTLPTVNSGGNWVTRDALSGTFTPWTACNSGTLGAYSRQNARYMTQGSITTVTIDVQAAIGTCSGALTLNLPPGYTTSSFRQVVSAFDRTGATPMTGTIDNAATGIVLNTSAGGNPTVTDNFVITNQPFYNNN